MITITITLDDYGRVTVTAPVDQKMVCYGMLETAKDVIHDAFAEKQSLLIQPAVIAPRVAQ